MKIRDFLKERFRKRLEQSACVVFYDPEERFRELVLDLEDSECRVIDGSYSTILSREQAMDGWRRLAEESDPLRYMAIYLPIPKPRSRIERQRDPYQAFAIGGSEFPYDDEDTFQALCRQAKSDFQAHVDLLFQAGAPDFDMVDAVDDAANWPKLVPLLKAESAVEIIAALLSPTASQRQALDKDESWTPDFKKFAKVALGYKLETESPKWWAVRKELAGYLLFTEFVQSHSGDLPPGIRDVPRAESSYADLIFRICDRLRTSEKHQKDYIEMANAVASELSLESHCEHIADFGGRGTFLFEESAFFRQFIDAVEKGDLERAREIVSFRMSSVWAREAEILILWTISERGLELCSQVEEMAAEWKKRADSLSSLFSYYTERLRRLDTVHRIFEQAVNDAHGEPGIVAGFVEMTRQRYLKLVEEVQECFIALVEKEGWPPAGCLKQTQVFEKLLAPKLEGEERIAFIIVDSLRYELAVEFQLRLAEVYPVELHAAAAQLPASSRVGAAALMPGAEGRLRLARKNGDIFPYIKDRKIKGPSDQLKAFQSLYGDRCAMMDLSRFIRKKKLDSFDALQLLILKTQNMDDLGTDAARNIARHIPTILKEMPAAIGKLKQLGFQHVVLASDHGFILPDGKEAGDYVPRPDGDWIEVKDRYLLGNGSADIGAVAFDAEHVGIKGEVDALVVPRSFGTFSLITPFVHGGLSLQESVIPVLSVDARPKTPKGGRPAKLRIAYKGGTTDLITTRRPMIEIVLFQEQIDYLAAKTLEFQLEAHANGKMVGEAASCPHLDPSANLIRIQLGQAIRAPLRMDDQFEGSFELRAIDPKTQRSLAALKLKTNYAR